jgi:uncharacterized protein
MEIFPRKFSRRQFLVFSPAALLGYMRFAEPRWLGVGRHSVKMSGAGLREPLTVLQLSDFHASDVVSLDFIDRSVSLGLSSCKPDLICLTGDFITTTWEDWAGYVRVLKRLVAAAPTYAALGNHDGGLWAVGKKGYADHQLVRTMLADAGIQLLFNARTVFAAKGWKLNVVGLGDAWALELDARPAFEGIDPAQPTLLLSHNPDTKDEVGERPWDLMLCGHTHGGQLLVPFVGTPFAPVLDHRYVAGLNRWEDRWIHTTKGVGNLHGARLNCRPEVSVLTLT